MTSLELIDGVASCEETEGAWNSLLRAAMGRLVEDLRRSMPSLAPRVADWMQRLSPTERPEDRFSGPLFYPFLQLPWYLGRSASATPDRRFQSDLAYSSLGGYYSLRLVDDFVDGNAEAEHRILPANSFFQLTFHRPYTRYFAAGHRFWADYFSRFFLLANDRMQAELSEAPRTREEFRELAVQKYCMVRIPLAAVCYRHRCVDELDAWIELSDHLACLAQMLDDLIDWRIDRGKKPTLLLSRSTEPEEDPLPWLLSDGLAWGLGEIDHWLGAATAVGSRLGCRPLEAYLRRLAAALCSFESPLTLGLAALGRLVARDLPPASTRYADHERSEA